MGPIDYILAAVCLYLAVLLLKKITLAQHRRYPPGPKGYPIVGNAYDFSSTKQWLTYESWSQQYDSDIVHARVLGQSTIILSSREVVTDLLEKRSAIYSDRPATAMMQDVLGFGTWNLAFMRYGTQWRSHRKCFAQSLHINAVDAYHQIQMESVQKLLVSFLDSPENFRRHINIHAGRIILKIAYDYDATPQNDRFIGMSDEFFRQLSEIALTGRFYLVDTLPLLKNLPLWVPGFKSHRLGAKFRTLMKDMMEQPYEMLQSEMRSGTAQSCIVVDSLDKIGDNTASSEQEDTVKHTAATVYPAGQHTSAATLTSFILAMTLSPEVQKKAQHEIDSITHGTRLPDFGDRKSLPYLHRVMLETLRWAPAAPAGISHRVMQDDVYKGYDIPEGSVVIGNIWAILHDEKVFSNPYKFDPDRFCAKGGDDPNACDKYLENYVLSTVFGFGRRVCPGKHLALNTAWLSMAQVLATFDVRKELDSKGLEVEPVVGFVNGINSPPEPFQCRLKPRSEEAVRLLRSSTEQLDGAF